MGEGVKKEISDYLASLQDVERIGFLLDCATNLSVEERRAFLGEVVRRYEAEVENSLNEYKISKEMMQLPSEEAEVIYHEYNGKRM